MNKWNRNQVIKIVQDWKRRGDTVVFTNGCFDILHAGHIHYLKEAKKLGDRLLIGLNTDRSVQTLKGKTRPINSEISRSTVLKNLSFIDGVTLFEEETPRALIEDILPHVLVKGGDYSVDEVVGADIMKKIGGSVVIIPFLEGFSTSDIITRIRNS
ncbi:MAG: D-glycero-beta-D-manno-heptose 1-phosphate adenylyltransferase [Candidatus Marinimicrobia bacterium]|nr:D-glycero-beta-D-manno-heptose 1-phosphate adenylyltransferase [Candidatus Neomarinimicrobiota bacterium]|tara:strand:- start:980 stop:1447 length:468 start_codon:yes stop_codon:yes gene_type:complete